MWIDTHCHLDAPEFGPNHALALDLRAQAAIENVALCVLQGVMASNFDTVRLLAQRTGDAYALGIHPLFVPRAQDGDLDLPGALRSCAFSRTTSRIEGELGGPCCAIW
jgi:TatD DNase family protein